MDQTVQILIVEDDPELASLMIGFLHRENYQVISVSNGKTIDAAPRQTRFDLILLDLILQQESGLELFKRIRATSEARVIMVSALTDVTQRVIGLELGADDYITKPFQL